MRLFRSLIALAVVVGAFGLPVAIPASATAALSAVDEPASEVTVDVVPMSSGILRPGDDLTIIVTLSNMTDAMVPAGSAAVYLDRSVIPERDDLAAWLDGTVAEDVGTDVLVAQAFSPALFAGESISLPAIVVPAVSLGFDASVAFGARELSVRLDAGGIRMGGARTSVTVDPGTGSVPTGISLAMPLALPEATTGIIPADLLDTYTSVNGLLYRQLEQAYGRPIALGIDPRILASIRLLGDTAPESATLWLERLRSAPNETFPLTYADTDIAATSQAGGGVLAPTSFVVDPTLFPGNIDTGVDGTPAPSASPTDDPQPPALPTLETLLQWDYTTTGVAWPRDSTVVSSDLDTFANAGLPISILDSDNSSIGASEVTPGAAAQVGEHAILTSDDGVSGLLREAVSASTELEWQSAMVRLTASLATLSAERTDTSRIVLATLGRAWPLGGFRLGETVDALMALPWAIESRLSSAIAQTPADATLVDKPVAEDRTNQLRYLFDSEAAVGQFSTVLVDPTLVTGERRLSLLALASQAWTLPDSGWEAAVADYLKRSGEIVASVQVVDSSTITVLSDKAQLPIMISNSLDFPVTVYVNVRPQKAILDVLDPRVKLTVEANSQKRASVPVQSVANGAVTIAISLSSVSGVVIAQPTYADINVNAGWETAATAALAVIVVIVFALGIVRTVRRRRRKRPRDGGPSDAAATAGAGTHE